MKILTAFNEKLVLALPSLTVFSGDSIPALPWRVRPAAGKAETHRKAGGTPLVVRTVRLYWSFVRAYRAPVIISLVALPLITLVQNGLLPMVYSRIIDRLHQTGGRIPHLQAWLALFLGLHLSIFVAQRVASRYWSKTEHNTIKDIEQHIFAKLLRQSNHFHASAHAGGLVAQAKRFTGAYASLSSAFYNNLYGLATRILTAFGFLLFIAPFMAFALLVWTAVYVISIYWLTKRKMHASEAAAAADSDMTAHLADAIGNVSVVKMFGTESAEGAAYAELSRDKYAKRRYDWRLSEIVMAWQSLLMIALEAMVLTMSINLVQHGAFTIGKLALVQFFLAPILASLWQIAAIFRQVEAGLSDAAEMTGTLAVELDVRDPARPAAAAIDHGHIQFQHVAFRYGRGEHQREIFSNFNLDIQPGQRIGLVGPSGSGKSSLTKLLLRFMDIDSGAITIDGQDVRDIRQADLRRSMAFVPQEPQLFHRSIRDNIRYAKPDASDEEVIAAARQARAHDFISKLPDGYDTLVGERGSKLSGGERQRVAIARAMLKDAPIVVLDEATSALDTESEKLIQAAFDTLMRGRTAIVIAHRLSTVQNMDRIVVLQDGRVVEDGTHYGLLHRKGLYAALWRHQTMG